jgi:hypothetical protein
VRGEVGEHDALADLVSHETLSSLGTRSHFMLACTAGQQ